MAVLLLLFRASISYQPRKAWSTVLGKYLADTSLKQKQITDVKPKNNSPKTAQLSTDYRNARKNPAGP